MEQIGGDVHPRLYRVCQEGFTNQITIWIFIHQLANFLQEREHLGLGDIVDVFEAVIRTQVQAAPTGIVAQFPVFEVGVEHIQAKTVHAALQPEAKHIQDCLAHFRIAEVEVGLFGAKGVVIILVQAAVVFPAGAAEKRQPVVGVISIRRRVPPEVPIVVWVVLRFQRFLEPGMLVGTVIQHQVHDDVNVAAVSFVKEQVKILHTAKLRVYVEIVRDVIAKIHIGGRVDWRKPDAVDAEVFEIVQALDDTLQIPDSIRVGILK